MYAFGSWGEPADAWKAYDVWSTMTAWRTACSDFIAWFDTSCTQAIRALPAGLDIRDPRAGARFLVPLPLSARPLAARFPTWLFPSWLHPQARAAAWCSP